MSTPADLSAADLTGAPATMRRAVDFDTGPDEGPVRVVYDEAHLAAAEQRGYRRAIQALRDEDRYERWCDADRTAGAGQSWPYWSHAPRFADYLEAVGEAP